MPLSMTKAIDAPSTSVLHVQRIHGDGQGTAGQQLSKQNAVRVPLLTVTEVIGR